MKNKNNEETMKNFLSVLSRYTMFFLLMSFVITCCMLLFLKTLQSELEIEYTQEQIQLAAKLTFGNVIFLSVICVVIDGIWRRVTVARPVKRITTAAQKVMQGDLTTHIQPINNSAAGFDTIIEYFNNMVEELSGMETLRTDFIANVSHELKTPLAVIQNYGTMLKQPGLSEEKRIEYARTITDTSQNLANMVSGILMLNKLENQKIYPKAHEFDLGEQLCECLIAFEDIWEDKNIEIETDIEENVMINADARLLSLVWNNLFSNAIKFTDFGGKISLNLEAANEYAVVKISDTGCGISKEVGEHIFEKFYQGDTSHATKGNGLGLALVKRVVDIAGGDISVASEVGKGSTFTVKLRRKKDEPL